MIDVYIKSDYSQNMWFANLPLISATCHITPLLMTVNSSVIVVLLCLTIRNISFIVPFSNINTKMAAQTRFTSEGPLYPTIYQRFE